MRLAHIGPLMDEAAHSIKATHLTNKKKAAFAEGRRGGSLQVWQGLGTATHPCPVCWVDSYAES
jgi:hypothetical protein